MRIHHRSTAALLTFALFATSAARAQTIPLPQSLLTSTPTPADFPLVQNKTAATLFIDKDDHEAVRLAAANLQADIARVTSLKPDLHSAVPTTKSAVIIGTLGHSTLIDALVKAGKLDPAPLAGKWESFQIATVANPAPGVDQALVIVGSDRRGTIFGIYELSQQIGVSPWYWWADVPVAHHDSLAIKAGTFLQGPPAVKYRGIFINDEDWGLHQWASKTFEPENKSIGPKTYEKVFELMLRLRLNYLWPAMHEVTREFHDIPENIDLAHRYGIVAGSSHCEPMLFNNAKWNQQQNGRWDYSLNKDKIFSTWENAAKTRGDKEAVWTLGIRGIHDQGMQGPPDVPTRIKIVSDVFRDQRALLEQYASKQFGPVAQCFIPYKEVLTLYDAGLQVPDDVTIVWVDDNFGYIRRLGKPQERARPGGAGVYWHLSYYGGPHSYLWINSTAPAHMWEELSKAWDNDARNLWVINVGDIKPMEIGIDYFSKFAWNPPALGPDSQPKFLRDFAAQHFGAERAAPIADLLTHFYRLGTVRKPELMTRAWAVALSDAEAARLRTDYEKLLADDERIAADLSAESRDAYFELIGFPNRILASTGLIFLADRDLQFGQTAGAPEQTIARLRENIDALVSRFNNDTAGGKWKNIMPGAVTARTLTAWNSQVRWPWGETSSPAPQKTPDRAWRDAASADRQSAASKARWTLVQGLGHTGRALALTPAGLDSTWKESDPAAPTLEYDFQGPIAEGDLLLDFLPSFRLYPGLQLRVAVSVDEQPPTPVELPGSNGKEDENGPNRRNGIQNNFVRARFPLPALSPGKHTLKIRPLDPGPVLDRVSFPSEK